MSRHELVSAFLDGRISRRTLIRRLIAGGVSTGAAISYAQVLSPERAGATVRVAESDHYPLVDLEITSTSLATVRTEGQLKVRITCTEELNNGFFRVFMRNNPGGVLIGTRFMSGVVLAGAGSRLVAINVSGIPPTRPSARLYVQMTANDAENYPALASTAKTLS